MCPTATLGPGSVLPRPYVDESPQINLRLPGCAGKSEGVASFCAIQVSPLWPLKSRVSSVLYNPRTNELTFPVFSLFFARSSRLQNQLRAGHLRPLTLRLPLA